MKQMDWRPFPYGDRAYRYTGMALSDQWQRLHRGDLEPYPTADRIADQIDRCGPALATAHDPARLADALQSAWRDYHAGDFGAAIRTAGALGPIGDVVLARAEIAYATYLEKDDRGALTMLCDAARRSESLARIDPACTNAWLLHAMALGRYSQRISVVKALARGLGSKIRQSLLTVLALEPEHAAALATFGVYHFEVIDKVGAVVGKMTHSATREEGVRCFEQALSIDPDSPITRMEYARALGLGRGRDVPAAEKIMKRAASCHPCDALARLDVERARLALNFS